MLTLFELLLHAASCDGFLCGSNKLCRIRHGQPRCVCAADCATLLHGVTSVSVGLTASSGVARRRRNATTEAVLSGAWHGPVCSFDGRTHRSLCSLAKSNCRAGRDLPVEYIGPCQSQFVTLSLAINYLRRAVLRSVVFVGSFVR